MAEIANMPLDPWQCWVAENALGETANGKWAAFEAALTVPRQCGKSALLEALILAALFVWGERTVIYSAHRFDTAQETFTRLQQLIEGSDFADEVAKIYTANGKEAIILKSGARVKFMARSRGTGRGFSGDRIIFDEAYDLAPRVLGAMIPTLAARSMRSDSNPQIWYASSAPHSTSVVLHSLRKRAQADDPGKLFYAEWSAVDDADPDDVDAWYEANPALGIRISEEFVRDERRALLHSPGEFVRERLGVPDPLPEDTDAKEVKLPAPAWAAAVTSEGLTAATPVTLAYEVTLDMQWASIVVAAGDQTSPFVEQLEHRKGVGWLPETIVGLVRDYNVTRLACVGAGPSGSQLGPVMLALSEAGLTVPLEQLSMVAYRQACGAFFTDVVEGRLRWFHGSGPLDAAARDAAARTYGDAWSWDIRNATVPISPLVAATVARALLPVQVDPGPPKLARVYSF